MTLAKGQGLYEFSLAASRAADQNEVWECLKSALAQYGVRWVNYAYGAPEALIAHSNMPDEWLRYYFEHYVSSDLAIKHCAQSVQPLYLNKAHYSGEVAFDERNDAMLYDLSGMGSFGSMAVPLAKTNSKQMGGSGIFFGLGNRDTQDVMEQFGEEITLIMHAAHQFLGGKELQTGAEVFSTSYGSLTSEGGHLRKNILLTTREKDVLRYLASGLRPDRIAEKMGLQVATINLHITKARKRLGATTREHAIVTAINTRQLIL